MQQDSARKLILNSELQKVSLLSKGHIGDVYTGIWRGSKVAKSFHLGALPARLADKFDIYNHLKHPNIRPKLQGEMNN